MTPDDEYADVPVAPDTEAARWEARCCQLQRENGKLHEQAARHMTAMAVAAKALARYAEQPNGGEQARAALEFLQKSVKGGGR